MSSFTKKDQEEGALCRNKTRNSFLCWCLKGQDFPEKHSNFKWKWIRPKIASLSCLRLSSSKWLSISSCGIVLSLSKWYLSFSVILGSDLKHWMKRVILLWDFLSASSSFCTAVTPHPQPLLWEGTQHLWEVKKSETMDNLVRVHYKVGV